MARLKNHGFKVGDILRFNAAGLRCNKIPVRGPENKFVTVIEIEAYTYRDGQTQQFYRVRDNATGYVYDQNHLKDAYSSNPTVINGLDGAYFTGKIYSRAKES